MSDLEKILIEFLKAVNKRRQWSNALLHVVECDAPLNMMPKPVRYPGNLYCQYYGVEYTAKSRVNKYLCCRNFCVVYITK